MSKGKVVKNYIYNTAYQILLVLTPLITSPYLARTLKATSVGIFNYSYSVVAYFVLFGTLGSALFAQREIAFYQENPEKRSKIFGEIVILRMFTVVITIGIYLIFAFSVRRYQTVFLILVTELISTAFDITWFFQGMEDFGKIVIRNTIFKIVGIVLIFIFVKSPADLYKYAFCFTIPTLFGNLSLWIYLPEYLVKARPELKSVALYIKPMLALFVPQIAIEVYTILDKTMIGKLSSNIDNVAYYTYSQNIVKALMQLITSLGVVMLPAMTNAFANQRDEEVKEMMGNSVKFVFMLGCPMMFGLAACANNLVLWFYGDGYAAVGPLMMAICPIILAIGLSTVIGKQFLLPSKRQTAFTVSVICGAAVNFVLNLLLIPKFSAIGASAATVCAEFTVVIVQICFVRKNINILGYLKDNIRYLIYSAIMFVAVYPISYVTDGIICTALQVVAGLAIYALCLIATKDKNLVFILNSAKRIIKRR